MTIAEWYDPREVQPEDHELVMVVLENSYCDNIPLMAKFRFDALSGFHVLNGDIWADIDLYETYDDFLKYGKENGDIWVKAWAKLPKIPDKVKTTQDDGTVVIADINNISEGYGEPYIVAKVVDGKLWYYGRYDTQERADEVIDTLNENNEAAIVLKKI